jgi:hypothetical protein
MIFSSGIVDVILAILAQARFRPRYDRGFGGRSFDPAVSGQLSSIMMKTAPVKVAPIPKVSTRLPTNTVIP